MEEARGSYRSQQLRTIPRFTQSPANLGLGGTAGGRPRPSSRIRGEGAWPETRGVSRHRGGVSLRRCGRGQAPERVEATTGLRAGSGGRGQTRGRVAVSLWAWPGSWGGVSKRRRGLEQARGRGQSKGRGASPSGAGLAAGASRADAADTALRIQTGLAARLLPAAGAFGRTMAQAPLPWACGRRVALITGITGQVSGDPAIWGGNPAIWGSGDLVILRFAIFLGSVLTPRDLL